MTESQDSLDSKDTALPRNVIRGESTSHNPKAGFIDWLNFTFRMPHDTAEFIALQNKLGAAFGFACSQHLKQGFLGYEECWELGDNFGRLATGGVSQKGTTMININGNGCMATKDWKAVYQLVVSLDAKITRIDLAHDDFHGVFDIDAALQMYATDQFTSSGRPPNLQSINDHGSGKGKTLYIGNRDNGKLLRVYEKGKQLGDPTSPWVRWELELHSTNRRIPLDAIIKPGDYLAGAYPCLHWISENQDRIKTTRQKMQLSFEQLQKHCSRSYGKLLWVMSQELGISSEEIVSRLMVKGAPSRLIMPTVGQGDPNYPDPEE